MFDIRTVCLSDLHIGQPNSLMTNVAATTGRDGLPFAVNRDQPSRTAAGLCQIIRALVAANESAGAERPTLLLDGDILEMDLADLSVADAGFASFLRALTGAEGNPFGRVLYLPGNHDHHLWEWARERQVAELAARAAARGSNEPADVGGHSTRLFAAPAELPRSVFLESCLKRIAGSTHVQTAMAYPNFGARVAPGGRTVIFSHGHFIDSVCYGATELVNLIFPKRKQPATVEEIEAENFAWIDFFWSTLGRSGAAGAELNQAYFCVDNAASRQAMLERVAKNLNAMAVAAVAKEPWWKRWGVKLIARTGVIDCLLQRGGDALEKSLGAASSFPLTGSRSEKLAWFVEQPLRRQMPDEPEAVSPETVFVFGHTHLPFQLSRSFAGFGAVRLCNIGGWVVETVTPDPHHGGSALLIDEQLHVAVLRLYNETADGAATPVVLEPVLPDDPEQNPFYQRLKNLMETAAMEKRVGDFAAATAADIAVRRQILVDLQKTITDENPSAKSPAQSFNSR